MIFQKIFDTQLQAFVFYSKGDVDKAPLPADTTPPHTGHLDISTHVVIQNTGSDLAIADEGAVLLSNTSKINFVGAGIYTTSAAGVATVHVDAGAGGEQNTASNVTTGVDGHGIFKQKTGVDLEFKSLKAGANITLASTATDVIITATALDVTSTGRNLGGEIGVYKDKSGVELLFKTFRAGTNIVIDDDVATDTIRISSSIAGEANTASNQGTVDGGIGLYKQKVESDLQFKSLKAGAGISIDNNPDYLTINSTAATDPDTMSNVGSGRGVFNQKSGSNYELRSLVPGSNISIDESENGSSLTISSSSGGEINTASNIGIGQGIFRQKTGVNFEFRSIIAGSNITVVPTPQLDALVISAPGATGETNTASNLGHGKNVFAQKSAADLQMRSLVAGSNITITESPTEITISSSNGLGAASDLTGSVTISGNNSSAAVVFSAPFDSADYKVYYAVHDFAGTPSSGSHYAWTTNATVTGFIINVAVPPGPGNTIAVGYSIGLLGTIGEINFGLNTGGGYEVYKTKSGSALHFRTLLAGSNISITNPTDDALVIAAASEIGTMSNVGGSGPDIYGIYKQKSGSNFELRSLIAGSNIAITSTADLIKFDCPAPGEVNTCSNIGTGPNSVGIFNQKLDSNFQFKSLVAGDNITIDDGLSTITINAVDPSLGGNFATAPTSAIHIYVAATGNDSNPGLQASPKATLAGAWAMLPSKLTGPFVVHMGAGTFEYTKPPPTLRPNAAFSFIVIVGDNYTTAATGTVSAGSTSSLVKTTGLITGANDCLTLEMTSGTANGCRRLITTTTTTDINLAYPLTNPIGSNISASNGDSFKIIRPNTVLEVTSTGAAADFTDCHLVNVALSRTASAVKYSQIGNDSGCQLFGVELQNSMYVHGYKNVHAGNAYDASAQKILDALSLPIPLLSWHGWGVSVPVAVASSYDSNDNSHFAGFWSGRSNLGYGGNNSTVYLLGGRVTAIGTYGDCMLRIKNATPFYVITDGNYAGLNVYKALIDGPLTILQNGNAPAIQVGADSSLSITKAVSITTVATGNAAIFLYQNSTAFFGALVTVSAAQTAAFTIQENAIATFSGLTATQATSSTIKGEAQVATTSMTLTNSTGTALTVRDLACLDVETGTLSCSSSAAGTATVQIYGGAKVRSVTTTNIANSSSSANSDGVRIYAGGEFNTQTNPVITSSGTTGYGVNCRGGGRAFFYVQPTGVTGITADFTVGLGAGEDFADTQLATSFAGVVSGLSGVVRSS